MVAVIVTLYPAGRFSEAKGPVMELPSAMTNEGTEAATSSVTLRSIVVTLSAPAESSFPASASLTSISRLPALRVVTPVDSVPTPRVPGRMLPEDVTAPLAVPEPPKVAPDATLTALAGSMTPVVPVRGYPRRWWWGRCRCWFLLEPARQSRTWLGRRQGRRHQ